MPTITFNGESFPVDHAVKGEDFVHGYDADSNCVIAIDGVSDFSDISYDGVYMAPGDCLAEACNNVKYCGGTLKTAGGQSIDFATNKKWERNGQMGYSSGTIEFGDGVAFFVVTIVPDVVYVSYYFASMSAKTYLLPVGGSITITEALTSANEDHTSASRTISATQNSVIVEESPQGVGYIVPISICAVKAV